MGVAHRRRAVRLSRRRGVGNRARGAGVDPATNHPKENPMKGALAWLIGIPIPIIIILYLLDVF